MKIKILRYLALGTVLLGAPLLGMDSSTDDETQSDSELTIGSFFASQVTGARELIAYGRRAAEDLLRIARPSETVLEQDGIVQDLSRTNQLLSLFLSDEYAFNKYSRCLPREMNRLLAHALLQNHPLIIKGILLEKLGRACCIQTLEEHTNWVASAEFNKAGDRVVTGSKDETAKIWDVSNGTCLATCRGHRDWINSVQFNTVGDRIVTASADKTAKIWNAVSGECVCTLKGHRAALLDAQFSPDGQHIVTASIDETAKIWLVNPHTAILSLPRIVTFPHNEVVRSAQFNAEGTEILTARYDGAAKIWNVDSRECVHSFYEPDPKVILMAAEFNGTEDKIVTAAEDNTAKIWDVASHQCLRRLEGHTQRVFNAQFDASGMLIVTASDDQTIKIWNATSGKCLYTLRGHRRAVRSARFNAHGDKIVSASHDLTAKIWDIASLFAATSWLQRDCSLEQALLLHCIYEARMVGTGLQKKQLGGNDVRFDFNIFPHLQRHFETLPALVQKALAPYVILKSDSNAAGKQ